MSYHLHIPIGAPNVQDVKEGPPKPRLLKPVHLTRIKTLPGMEKLYNSFQHNDCRWVFNNFSKREF